NVPECRPQRIAHPIGIRTNGYLALLHHATQQISHEWQFEKFQIIAQYRDKGGFAIIGKGQRTLQPVDMVNINFTIMAIARSNHAKETQRCVPTTPSAA